MIAEVSSVITNSSMLVVAVTSQVSPEATVSTPSASESPLSQLTLALSSVESAKDAGADAVDRNKVADAAATEAATALRRRRDRGRGTDRGMLLSPLISSRPTEPEVTE
ncbi:MAG: hypothetical protein QM747_20435 [Nocardioides sp.]